MKAIVYLMHSSSEQLDLWLQYLPSEDLAIVNIPPTEDLVQVLEKTPSKDLPNLILVEMSIQSPNNNLLQASNVSRWCKENQPSIKIVLLTVRQELELTKLEQRWAVRQGALCLLPKLEEKNLSAQISQVYEYLGKEPPTVTFSPILQTPSQSLETTSQTWINTAKSLVADGDFAAAMNQLKEVIQNDRDSIEAYLLCGEIYSHLKNPEKAIQAYSKALSIDPSYVISYLKRGLTYNSLKNYHAAIADFNFLIKLEPNYAEAYNARGLARRNIGDIEGARIDFNQAIGIDPKYAEAYLNRGMLLYSLGEQTGARTDYEQAVKLDSQYEGDYYAWSSNSEIKGLSVF